jgi:peptidoglycan/LPS O-acetylase OafA/YrhL
VSAPTATIEDSRQRVSVLTVIALQAGAALLFALSQLVPVMDPEWLVWIEPLDGIFRSGNLAITVLLATEGYAVATLLVEHGTRRAAEARVLAYVGSIWLLLALVCLGAVGVQHFDHTDPESWEHTRSSILHVLTFSWNTWIAEHPFASRADLVSLWFFSIVVQLTAVLAVAGLVLRRWPRLLGVLLVVAAVGSTAYRVYALDEQGWFAVALSTYARADAFLLGAAMAFLVPVLSARAGAALSGSALLCLLGLVISSSFLDVDQVFLYQVPFAAVLTAMFVAGAHAPPDPRALTVELLTARDVVNVSRAWRDLVAWSLLVTVTVQRHTTDQPAFAATSTTVIVLAVVVVLSRNGLDRAQTALSSMVDRRRRPGWHRASSRTGSAEPGPEDRGARGEPPADP